MKQVCATNSVGTWTITRSKSTSPGTTLLRSFLFHARIPGRFHVLSSVFFLSIFFRASRFSKYVEAVCTLKQSNIPVNKKRSIRVPLTIPLRDVLLPCLSSSVGMVLPGSVLHSDIGEEFVHTSYHLFGSHSPPGAPHQSEVELFESFAAKL